MILVRPGQFLYILHYKVLLDHIAAGVLYLLWRRRRNRDGSLVSARVLCKELTEGASGTRVRLGLKVSAVKAALRRLLKAGMVEDGTAQRTETGPGPAPKGYRFSVDAPLISWRATAAVAMMLHNHQDRFVKREVLVEEAFTSGLTHHNREERLTRDEISDLVEYCLRKGYFKEVDVNDDKSYPPIQEKRLTTTSKVDEQALFLEKVAAEVKRQPASELPPESSDDGEKPRAG